MVTSNPAGNPGELYWDLGGFGSDTFVNNGLFDLMTGGSQTLPANFTNHGTVLLASDVVIKSFSKSAATFTLTIAGYAGHTYQLQRSTTLQSGDWVNIGPPQNGVGAVLTVTETPRIFYRIMVSP